MDRSDFDCTVEKTDWEYEFSFRLMMEEELLRETTNPSPLIFPAGLDIHPQPVESLIGGYDGDFLLGAPPYNLELVAPITYERPLYDPDTTQSGHLYGQPGAHSQGQYLPYQRLVDGVSRVAATSYPGAPLGGFNTHPLPVENLSRGYGGYFHLRAPPHTFEQPGPLMATGQAAPIIYDGPLYDPDTTQSGHLYGQPGAHSQGQYLPYQWPVDDVPRVATASYPGAPLVEFDTITFEEPRPLMATPGVTAGQAAPIIYDGPLYDPDTTQSGHLYGQPGAHIQGQYLPYQWPMVGFPAAASYPAAPPHPYNQMPAVRLPEDMGQNLRPIEALNGDMMYELAADVSTPPYSAAPPLNTSVSKKRKRESQQHDDQQYIKKPPNAFMLFMKEQRPNVVASFNITDNALVNSILGERWKLLSNKQKAKYYEQADEERRLHSQKYPNWSFRENYGKMRKRNRKKAPTSDEGNMFQMPETLSSYLQNNNSIHNADLPHFIELTSASKPQSDKKLRLTSAQTGVMVPSTSRTRQM